MLYRALFPLGAEGTGISHSIVSHLLLCEVDEATERFIRVRRI